MILKVVTIVIGFSLGVVLAAITIAVGLTWLYKKALR